MRVIFGFSQILTEEYSQELDDEGQDYLNRVLEAAKRMDELIDTLLTFSRLARVEIVRVETTPVQGAIRQFYRTPASEHLHDHVPVDRRIEHDEDRGEDHGDEDSEFLQPVLHLPAPTVELTCSGLHYAPR